MHFSAPRMDFSLCLTSGGNASTRSGALKEIDTPVMFYYVKNLRMPNEIWDEMMEKRRKVVEEKILRFNLEDGGNENDV